MKLCITYHCNKKYNIFFKYFIKSFEDRFCKDCERTFFIFTDDIDGLKQQIQNVDIKSTIKYFDINPCQFTIDEFKFRKFKFLNMAESSYKDFDYIVFCNGNLVCKRLVNLNELFNNKQQFSVIHPMFKMNTEFYESLCKDPQSSAYFDHTKLKCYRYYQAAFFGANYKQWQTIIDFVESCRYYDKYNHKESSVPWHDETYYNKLINIIANRSPDQINILDGKYYIANNFQIELAPYIKLSKLCLVDKQSLWNDPTLFKKLDESVFNCEKK